MKLSDISKVLCTLLLKNTACQDKDCTITGVCFDSREVKKDNVFVAITGVKTDGHLYIPKAIDLGACCVICENEEEYKKYTGIYKGVTFFLVNDARKALALVSKHFYNCADEKLKIIGITGTKGKTSTSFMIAGVLNKAGKRCGIIGTTGAYFEDFYLEMNHSTPESRDLHSLFDKMYSLGAEYVVMEVSSQALMMSRVYGINFECGVFTNISPDHIGEGEHKDFEDYLYWKTRLFEVCKKAVVNKDADRADEVIKVCRDNGCEIITYSCKEKQTDFYADNEIFYIENGMKTKFDLYQKGLLKGQLEVGVPGKFSVFNALCAISCTITLGVSYEAISNALKNVKVIGRTEPVDNPKLKVPVIIDYAHNAMSLESLFAAVKAYNPKRIICVFGCGGNRSKLRRYEMGEISGKYADISIITEDNSRFEELDDIINDILVGMHKTNGKYEIVKNRRLAIYRAIELSQQGDIVLLAGKGQETYLEIKGEKTHFDEREIVNSYFEQ